MKPLHIGFAGTPDFGIPCLEAIAQSGHSIDVIYTQPDRPAGRGQKLHESDVKTWAIQHNIPVVQPPHFNEAATRLTLERFNLDVLVVIAYGLILPASVLAIPKYGCINVHASLLPRWRGASPIQHAILSGDTESGITIMEMDRGMDTGAIITQNKLTISAQDTAATLHHKLAQQAAPALMHTLNSLLFQKATWVAQQHAQATHAPKINKQQARLNWQHTAQHLDRQVRAYNPWPMAFFQWQDTPIRVHQAKLVPSQHGVPGEIISLTAQGVTVATGKHTLCLEVIQFPGGKAMPIATWLKSNHLPFSVGMILS